jgi:hypothetical protein
MLTNTQLRLVIKICKHIGKIDFFLSLIIKFCVTTMNSLFMSFQVRRTCTFITAKLTFIWFISYMSADMFFHITAMVSVVVTLNASEHKTDIIVSLDKFARFTMVHNCVY